MKAFTHRLAVGVIAGTVGTAAMDTLLYRRYRQGGGSEDARSWESAAGVSNWEQASAPGKLGQKAERLVLGHEPPASGARPTTNFVHWATGIGWGISYALLASRTPKHPWIRALALGPFVWLSGYVVLPVAKVYEPIWNYDAQTLGKDFSAHLVYGTATSATVALLSRTARS